MGARASRLKLFHLQHTNALVYCNDARCAVHGTCERAVRTSRYAICMFECPVTRTTRSPSPGLSHDPISCDQNNTDATTAVTDASRTDNEVTCVRACCIRVRKRKPITHLVVAIRALSAVQHAHKLHWDLELVLKMTFRATAAFAAAAGRRYPLTCSAPPLPRQHHQRNRNEAKSDMHVN